MYSRSATDNTTHLAAGHIAKPPAAVAAAAGLAAVLESYQQVQLATRP